MIKLQNYTPEIYYKESRDFQLLGRLFDLVLNAVKTDIDLIYNIPLTDNSDEKLLELMALTLGFKPKHHYSAKQLKAVCSVFSEIIRNKGSIKALKIACEALFSAMDIAQAIDYDFAENADKTELNLYVSSEFGDITILNDLITYILPAGMSCNIIREYTVDNNVNTNIAIMNTIKLDYIDIVKASKLPQLNDETIKAITKPLQITDAKTNDVGFSTNSEIIKLDSTTILDSITTPQIKEENNNG